MLFIQIRGKFLPPQTYDSTIWQFILRIQAEQIHKRGEGFHKYNLEGEFSS